MDMTGYEQMSATRDGHTLFRKIENGKGLWAAQPFDESTEPFPISYEQALGYEPIVQPTGVQALAVELGKMLLPNIQDNGDGTRTIISGHARMKAMENLNKQDPLEQLQDKISNMIKNGEVSGVDKDGNYEIYTDYSDRELSTHFLKEIFSNENPYEAFSEKLGEWAIEYDCESYGRDNLEKEIKDALSEEEKELWEEHSEQMNDFLTENICFYYNEQDFNSNIRVNILVDCGNWNYDYTRDNVLNWDGTYGVSDDLKGNIDEESSLLWLAKQQGKEKELRQACKDAFKDGQDYGNYGDGLKTKDKFIESCLQEYENLSCSMGTLTFLVEMPLLDVFSMMELQNKEIQIAKDAGQYGKYDPRETLGESLIVFDKSTMCGLFNPCGGGGSVLEVELDKDVELPLKFAKIAPEGCRLYGYDVNEVYGLIGSCWKETVKQVIDNTDKATKEQDVLKAFQKQTTPTMQKESQERKQSRDCR